MAEASNPLWDATLEESVRLLLQQSSGTGATAIVPGLGIRIEDMPTRIYAEQWLAKKDIKKQAAEDAHAIRKERRERVTLWLTIGTALSRIALWVARKLSG